jgi:hypothetical protein
MEKAVFEGLVFDEDSQPLQVTHLGTEAFYVLDDAGFMRHIPAADVDRQVWDAMAAQMEGKEDLMSEQAARMMGQDDPFSIAVIRAQFENKDKQFEELRKVGLPADARDYLGMMGFRVVVDHHGEMLELKQPSASDPDGDPDE